MKTTKIASLLLMSMMLTTKLFAQTDTKEQLVVPLSEPTKAYSLNAGLVNGSIKIVTYAGKDIVIDAEISSNKKDEDRDRERENRRRNSDDSKESTAGMKRIVANAGFELTAEEKNNHVTIGSDSWKRGINLTIKIPQGPQATLKISTVNHGDILIENVNGELEVNNVNGAITLTNVSGSVVANTVNGKIMATFGTIDPKAAMAFSTLNGNVDVTFPAAIKANVKLKSDRGEIYSDFDVDVDKSQPKTNRTTEKGMYRINIEEWVYGKINGGGPEIMMKNMNGNIYVRKAK